MDWSQLGERKKRALQRQVILDRMIMMPRENIALQKE